MWKSIHPPKPRSNNNNCNNINNHPKKVWKVEKPNVWQKLFRVKLEPSSCWGTNNAETDAATAAVAESNRHSPPIPPPPPQSSPTMIQQPDTTEQIDTISNTRQEEDEEAAARVDSPEDEVPTETRSQDCCSTNEEAGNNTQKRQDVRESIAPSSSSSRDNFYNNKSPSMKTSNNNTNTATTTTTSRPRASSYDCIPPPSPRNGGKIPRPTTTTKRSTTSAFQPPATPVQQRPPMIQNRAISYTSTGSRHRRDSAVLPDLKSVLSNEEPPAGVVQLTTTVVPDIPKTLDRLKCFRQVSALDDDCSDAEFVLDAEEEDDREDDPDNLSYSSDEEDEVDPKISRKQKKSSTSTSEETASPASVIPDAPDEWMNAWVNNCNNNPNTSIEQVEPSEIRSPPTSKPETDDSTVETSVAEPVYVPITPRPKKASSDAVFTAGWTAVLMEDLPPITNDTCCGEDEDPSQNNNIHTTRPRKYSSSTVESTLPTITPRSLYYVQLLPGPVLEFSTATECLHFALDPEDIVPCPVSFAMLSKRTGHAVIIESATKQFTILPVLLSTTHLQRLVSLQQLPSKSLEKALGSEWNGSDYASHAQHDASMHLRFAMDAALRMARS